MESVVDPEIGGSAPEWLVSRDVRVCECPCVYPCQGCSTIFAFLQNSIKMNNKKLRSVQVLVQSLTLVSRTSLLLRSHTEVWLGGTCNGRCPVELYAWCSKRWRGVYFRSDSGKTPPRRPNSDMSRSRRRYVAAVAHGSRQESRPFFNSPH
jgi:hypothetical protein